MLIEMFRKFFVLGICEFRRFAFIIQGKKQVGAAFLVFCQPEIDGLLIDKQGLGDFANCPTITKMDNRFETISKTSITLCFV